MTDTTPCMGGWCAKRDQCPHFHADRRNAPAERLCPPKLDGAMLAFAVIVPVRSLALERAAA